MKWRLLAVSCGILALGLLLYPLIGELLSERYHSDVETVYAAAIADADDAELTAQRRAAEVYNAMLRGEAAGQCGRGFGPSPALCGAAHGGRGHVYYRHPEDRCVSPGAARHGRRRRWNGPWGMWWGLPCLWAGQAAMRCCRPTAGWLRRSCFQTLTSW